MRKFSFLLKVCSALLLLFFCAYEVGAAAPKFSPGDRAEVSVKTTNVRAEPFGAILGEQQRGSVGTVSGGPVFKHGYQWWQVDFDTGADGWVIQSNIKSSAKAPPIVVDPHDYNNDQKVDAADIAFLTDVSNKAKACPSGKTCDINSDGIVDFLDVFRLRDIRHDINSDGFLNNADPQVIADVLLGLRTCPAGKSCDINESGFVTAVDASELSRLVLARTSVPVLSPNGGEVIVAGTPFLIRWDVLQSTPSSPSPASEVRITYRFLGDNTTPGGNDVLIATVANGGSYTWPVPTGFSPGRYAIGITRVTGTEASVWADDYSNGAFTVTSQGGWSVSVSPSAPVEKWVVAGSTGVVLNVLRLTATTEDFALTNLRLQVSTKGSSSASSFSKISLWDGNTKIVEKIPAFVNGVEDFVFPASEAGSLLIPKDSYKDLTVKADLAGIGAALSGRAGELVGVDYDGATPDKNRAVGMSSGTSKKSSTWTDQTGRGVATFRSLPTLERLPLPTTTLTSGNHVLYKFQVRADPAYDVAISQFTFQIATTGVTGFGAALPDFALRNVTDGNKRVAAATGTRAEFFSDMARYSDGSGTLLFKVIADTTDYTTPYVVVPAGQSHIFELRGSVTTDGSGDSVVTKLVTDAARPLGVSLVGKDRRTMVKTSLINNVPGLLEIDQMVKASSTAFVWSDFSSDATTTHSIHTADWMNSYKVPGSLGSSGLDSSSLINAASPSSPKHLVSSGSPEGIAAIIQSLQAQVNELLRQLKALGR